MPVSLGAFCVVLAWGALCSVGLVVGAIAGSLLELSHRGIALVMAIGAGLLLAAATLELASEALRIAGPVATFSSLLLGAFVVSVANARLAGLGAAHRKRCGDCTPQPSESQVPGSGVAIALGTAVDAVPEALVLGLALREATFPVEMLIAIAVGNLSEAFSGATGMRSAGRSYRFIFLVWCTIAVGAAVATAVGYAAFGSLGPSWRPHLLAFGAGALLAMTAETMIPEAFHNSPRFSGFVAAIGFCVVLLLGAAAHE
jgi:ZIP family zinc transporter